MGRRDGISILCVCYLDKYCKSAKEICLCQNFTNSIIMFMIMIIAASLVCMVFSWWNNGKQVPSFHPKIQQNPKFRRNRIPGTAKQMPEMKTEWEENPPPPKKN